jgi:hypothetical protein
MQPQDAITLLISPTSLNYERRSHPMSEKNPTKPFKPPSERQLRQRSELQKQVNNVLKQIDDLAKKYQELKDQGVNVKSLSHFFGDDD